jgi:hypothetical protein
MLNIISDPPDSERILTGWVAKFFSPSTPMVVSGLHHGSQPRLPATGHGLAMNFIGLGLADARLRSQSFRKNYTSNEADYYMFRQVRTMRLTGLLEVGELTCEKSERKLIVSSHAVSTNVARAIDFILRTHEAGALITPEPFIRSRPAMRYLRRRRALPKSYVRKPGWARTVLNWLMKLWASGRPVVRALPSIS